jgi:hypothetical protein
VCSLSPDHKLVDAVIERANAASGSAPNWVYRIDPV